MEERRIGKNCQVERTRKPWETHGHLIKNISKAFHFRSDVTEGESVKGDETARKILDIG